MLGKKLGKFNRAVVLALSLVVLMASAAFAGAPEYAMKTGPTSGAQSVLTTAGMMFKVNGVNPATAKVSVTVYAKYGVSILGADGSEVLATTNNASGLDTGTWVMTAGDLNKPFAIVSKKPFEKQDVRLVFNTDAEATYTVYVAEDFPVEYPAAVSPINWTTLSINATGTAIDLKHGEKVTFRNVPTGAKLQVISVGGIALINRMLNGI